MRCPTLSEMFFLENMFFSKRKSDIFSRTLDLKKNILGPCGPKRDTFHDTSESRVKNTLKTIIGPAPQGLGTPAQRGARRRIRLARAEGRRCAIALALERPQVVGSQQGRSHGPQNSNSGEPGAK